jgi:hypothetical protein
VWFHYGYRMWGPALVWFRYSYRIWGPALVWFHYGYRMWGPALVLLHYGYRMWGPALVLLHYNYYVSECTSRTFSIHVTAMLRAPDNHNLVLRAEMYIRNPSVVLVGRALNENSPTWQSQTLWEVLKTCSEPESLIRLLAFSLYVSRMRSTHTWTAVGTVTQLQSAMY